MLNIFNIFRKSNRGAPIIEERTNGLITAPDGHETIIHDANFEEILNKATGDSYMHTYYVDSFLKHPNREQANNIVETESLAMRVTNTASSRTSADSWCGT